MAESIAVTDRIEFPERFRGQTLRFLLHADLRIDSSVPRARDVTEANGSAGGASAATTQIATTAVQAAPSREYEITLPRRGDLTLDIAYRGRINDLAEEDSPQYAQSFAETSGIISPEGVFLSAASRWLPGFGDELLSFRLQARFADSASSWTAVSQGRRVDGPSATQPRRPAVWEETRPMEEVYLIAADFTVYEQPGETDIMAFLRTPDANLASRYMEATARYLALYEPLLGDYPYGKFALVENFWETGYGMPSFTLLGERVLRLPFILESSYPHEILHNWWGNGVYPDYDSGNWSEGLTAYLADHLFDEVDGLGAEYRKEMLARYRNYVAEDSDFPLNEFTARNSAASQAVGYGKTLLLWHMLRRELGDEMFLEGLRRFYADRQFQRASWADIEALFSAHSGRDLSEFFNQWVTRTGAPELSLSVQQANGDQARIMLAQIQSGPAYELTVPVALFYEDEEAPYLYDIEMGEKLHGVLAEDYDSLRAVLVDPYYDLFRRLDREETPPTLGELFGAERIVFVLPERDQAQWRRLAEAFARGREAEILSPDALAELPADRAVWVLGRDNPFAAEVLGQAADYGAGQAAEGYRLDSGLVPFANRSTVLVARHPASDQLSVGLIHIDDLVALPGMIEKLPHYGKYSYLSFSGPEPTNDVKGQWSSPDSPMLWTRSGFSGSLNLDALPAQEALATLPAKFRPAALSRHVEILSSPQMQGRGLGSRGLDRAADYIQERMEEAGLQPVAGETRQRFPAVTVQSGEVELVNVLGMIPGSDPALAGAPVVVGAHYDHLGIEEGERFPGADDNASGVSAMLEVAASLRRGFTPARPILFVAFSGEEAGLLGSTHFVNNPPGDFETEDFHSMVNLDAVGRLEGRSLQVFGSGSAYEWPFMAQGIGFTIGLQSTFPTDTLASSDHVPFLNAGIPAIHLFAGTHPDYHRSSDTPARLDYAGLSQVARWLEEAVMYLAANREPLRTTLGGQPAIRLSGESEAREASLGTVPDFAHSGRGVGISSVMPGSAAEAAGLQAGDVLLRFNGEETEDLQAYSDLLRGAAPGDRVRLEIERDGRRLTLEAELGAR